MVDYGFGVTLGTIDPADSPRLREWRNLADIRKWCRQTDLISHDDQRRWYEFQDRDQATRMYAVYEKELVGIAGFTSIDNISRRAEFSLYIAPEFQRRGLARKALKTLFTHGFKSKNFNLIWGESFDGNPAMSLFEDLGMKREGTRREFYFKDGAYIDAHLFSVLKREWRF